MVHYLPIDILSLSSNLSEEYFDLDFIQLTSDTMSTDVQKELERAELKSSLSQEVKGHILEDCEKDLLTWWKRYCFRYLNAARVARKQLAVTATSAPSERVFSIWGLVGTSKRSPILGESTEAHAIVYNNKECVQFNDSCGIVAGLFESILFPVNYLIG